MNKKQNGRFRDGKFRGRFRLLIGVDLQRNHILKIQAAIYFLSIFLLFALNIWIDNMGRFRQVQAAEYYGSWHYGLIGASAEDREIICQNRLLKSAGRAAVYGEIYREDGLSMGNIGTVDAVLPELCGMEFVSGGLPEKENEIALEQNMMEQLGISGTVGEEFVFWTRELGEENSEESEMSRLRTYILCGVFQNNSAYTEAGAYLPEALVTEGTAEKISRTRQEELFIQLVDGCDIPKVKEELAAAILRAGGAAEERSWIQNAFVYGKEFERGDTRGLRMWITLAGYAVMFGLVFVYVVRERGRMNILRSLGMREREVLALLAAEQALIFLAALALALVVGVRGTGLFLEHYIRRQGMKTAVLYPRGAVGSISVVCGLILSGGVTAGWLCTGLEKFRQRIREAGYEIPERRRITPLRGGIQRALMRREMEVRKRVYLVFFCMQTLILTAASLCLGWFYGHYEGYEANRYVYICDYIAESAPSAGSGTDASEQRLLLSRIRNMGGVETLETVYRKPEAQILNEEVRSGEYYQAWQRGYIGWEEELSPTLFAVDSEELLKELAAQVDAGEWDQERLDAGKEVVIYLPIQRISETDTMILLYRDYLGEREVYDREYPAWMETEIRVGDTLRLKVGDRIQEVEVGGIIYDAPATGDIGRTVLSDAYSIYCGEGLFQKLAGEDWESLSYIRMAENTLTPLAAERMENLLKESRVSWENIRGKVLPQLRYHRNGMAAAGAFLGTVGILGCFAVSAFLNKEMKTAAYKNRVLQALGIAGRGRRLYLRWYVLCLGAGALAGLAGYMIAAEIIAGGAEQGFISVRLKREEIFPLLAGLGACILLLEGFSLRLILRKKEKSSKNLYYFVP